MNAPDENLVQYVEAGFVGPGAKVLDLGCGPGRNAIYLAELGCEVDAVDLSQEALNWANERAVERNVQVRFMQNNIFALRLEPASYDLIYDSGCLHHIAPHRRMDYVSLLDLYLKPGGYYGLTCFAEQGAVGGSDITDWEVYRQRSLKGGLGYNPEKLIHILKGYEAIEIRRMKQIEQPSDCFGHAGLWTALFRK